MFQTILLSLAAAQCPLYSYTEKPAWKDISQGKQFFGVAANTESDALWARLKTRFSSGEGLVIAEYRNEVWIEDPSQPKGAWSIAVDSKGMPALTAHTSNRHIFHK